MKQKFTRTNIVLAVVVLALAAFFLRLSQLALAFDAEGMITGKGIWLFSVVTVLAVAAFALYSRSLKGRKKYNAIAGQGRVELVLGAAAALLIVVSGAVLFLNAAQPGDRLVAVGSVLTGICWGITAASRYIGKKVSALLFMLPAAFYVVDLVCRFRFWSRDPIIIDYCYDLFALIGIMCATFHLGGFCFEKGARRLTVFFSLCGVFFSAAALVKASAANVLSYGAAILWLLANLWLLLRNSRKREEEPVEGTEAADVPEDPAEETEEPEDLEKPEEIEEAGDTL